jgi:hypothetical protein
MACQRSIQTVVGECNRLAAAVKWAIQTTDGTVRAPTGVKAAWAMLLEIFREMRETLVRAGFCGRFTGFRNP